MSEYYLSLSSTALNEYFNGDGVLFRGGLERPPSGGDAAKFIVQGGAKRTSLTNKGDTFYGNHKNDLVHGYSGNDVLKGGGGRDTLKGGDGNDLLEGGSDNDRLCGGSGNDTLIGGSGQDTLKGNAGADTFVLQLSSARDKVADFQRGVDVLKIEGDVRFEDLSFSKGSIGTLIKVDGQSLALIKNVSHKGWTKEDFELSGNPNSPATPASSPTPDPEPAPEPTPVPAPEPAPDPVAGPDAATPTSAVLDQVPSYDWYHGCGPTAVGSIIGYWDLNGYDGLFDASGWDDVRLTANVKDEISSPLHNAKYDPTPDNPNLPAPADTSIADFFQTSEGSLGYGWSYLSKADDAFEGYAAYRGYDFDAQNHTAFGNGFNWDDLVAEIDAGRPPMFLVDRDGNSVTDHFVPVVGYDDRGNDGKWYAFYTTYHEAETLTWKEFQPMGDDVAWGVGYVTEIRPGSGGGGAQPAELAGGGAPQPFGDFNEFDAGGDILIG